MKIIMTCAAIALALPLAACGPHQLSADERMTAELGARDYADRSASDYVGCSGQDSDKDGYVTCETKGRAAPHVTTEILCAYASGSRGCKRKV